MKLRIDGERVEQLVFDYQFKISTEQGGLLQIESKFSFWESPTDEPKSYDPETSRDIGKVLPFVLHAIITDAHTDDLGNLTVELENGARIEVPFDPDYEAWTFVNRKHFMVVPSAGGGLTVWSGDDRRRTDNV